MSIPQNLQNLQNLQNQYSHSTQKHFSTTEFILSSICLSGIQFAWTVELAFGTPYLLSLGLPTYLTAMVWLAGPLAGLVIQPLIGVYADNSTHRLGKRRPFMILGGILVVLSIIMIAYSSEIVYFFMGKQSDNTFVILIAVTAFYFMDFSINAVQACSRALIVDVAPFHQQDMANAWGGRMIGFGNILGYFVGFLDLPRLFPALGSTQLKGLCVIAILWFSFTLSLTCICTKEIPNTYSSRSHRQMNGWAPIIKIYKAMKSLPWTLQSVCNVQFFGWLGWFPFIFYSTSWIAHKDGYSTSSSLEEKARYGSFALLIYSILSVLTIFGLPYIRYSQFKSNNHVFSIASMNWIWATSFWIFSFLVFSSFFVSSVSFAMTLIALCGYSWGVTQWVPFTLMGEYVSFCTQSRRPFKVNDSNSSSFDGECSTALNGSNGSNVMDGSTGLYQNVSVSNEIQNDVSSYDIQNDVDVDTPINSETTIDFESLQRPSSSSSSSKKLNAGMVLGIHNIYIVLPQFVSTLLSTMIFGYTSYLKSIGTENVDEFGWVLRLGAAFSIIAGILSLYIEEVNTDEELIVS